MEYIVNVENSNNSYILDEDGYVLFNKYTWFATSGDYPYLRAKVNNIVLKFHIELMKDEVANLLMHNLEGKRIVVDHISGNVYDNRKSNLRVVTQSENNMNKKIQSNNTSGVIGVTWHKKDKKWQVNISKGKREYIGSFYYFRNAVKARIEAEKELFGEHAFYNRDEEYREMINSILNMEDIKEPIFTARKGKYGINGVSNYGNKYRARIAINDTETSSIHDTLDSAITWRREMEIETYGQLLSFKDNMLERQI